MDLSPYFKSLFGLLIVLGLFYLILYLLKKWGYLLSLQNKNTKRLKIIETLYIDTKSKFLLVKRDETEHLILINNDQQMIIESNIKTNEVNI